jgi:phosphoglycerate dehydrogenase-like enzyme
MKHVLVGSAVHPETLEKIRQRGDVQVFLTEDTHFDQRKTNIYLGDSVPASLAAAANLEFIQLGSVGYSQLYGLNLPQRGVRVSNARGVFDPTIAEWNIAMMINLLRDVPRMFRHQRQAIWDRDAVFQRELRGKTVGIWGYGGIGRATARLAKAFGLRVCVLVRSGVSQREATYLVPHTGDPEGVLPDRIFTVGQERAFLSGLDFLIMAVPQTPQTTGMVGEAELKCLPPHAYLLNPARGPIVREEALLRALREGWIAGAALDTHYYYPMPPDHPLWTMPNVILTPHISGSSSSPYYLERLWDIFAQNVDRLIAGRALLNEISPDQLAN